MSPNHHHHHNPNRLHHSNHATAQKSLQNLSNYAPALDEIRFWPEYTPQPLWSLPTQAAYCNIKKLYFKDESKRFSHHNLNSFKALGAPYAVFRILTKEINERLGVRATSQELRSRKYADVTRDVTVCVATDGNQGRGLAFGAKIFGCECVVYIHLHVSENRARAIANLGASVVRVDGEYEVSVQQARQAVEEGKGWYFVSSTSWNDFQEDIARDVMVGYMMVVEEMVAEMGEELEALTHVFVCGGVGSIAAAIFMGLYDRLRSEGREDTLPRFIVVEPNEADCLLQSALNSSLQTSTGSLKTVMAGLACRTPSPAAFKVLQYVASDFVSVPDDYAVEGMRALAKPEGEDVPIVCGESSAASLGLLRAGILRKELGLDDNSNVLVFGLEGATDEGIYEEIVGVEVRLFLGSSRRG